MNQGFEFSFWLGIAGVALIGANVLLWHTQRALNRPRQAAGVPEVRLVPSPVLVPAPAANGPWHDLGDPSVGRVPVLAPAAVLLPSAVEEIASWVIAT